MAKAPSSTDNLFANVLAAGGAAPAATPAPAAPVHPVAPTAPEAPVVEEEEAPAPAKTHLDTLKQKANLMGISYSNNIGIEALKAKIDAKMNGETEVQESQEQPQPEAQTLSSAEADVAQAQPKKDWRQELRDEEMKLIRVRITNMDPKKKDLPGEILTVANRFIGNVRKYIPYGEATENGYCIPNCLYKQLKERQFQHIKVTKDSEGREKVVTKMVREFALEVLPQLTEKELAQLAASQAAAGGLD